MNGASGKEVRRSRERIVPNVPGGALEEVVALPIHQLAAEPRHLVLHLSHLGVEALAYVGELGVDHAEVTELDRNVALDTTVGHVFSRVTLVCLLSLNHSNVGTYFAPNFAEHDSIEE